MAKAAGGMEGRGGGKDEKGNARELERAENKVNGSYSPPLPLPSPPENDETTKSNDASTPAWLEMNPIFQVCDLEIHFM